MLLLLALTAALAAESPTQTLTIQNHRFSPDRIEVPFGQPFTLLIKNNDKTAEEFESSDLGREQVIAPGKEKLLKFKALQAGEYRFFGDFHKDTARGAVTVTKAR